MGNPGQAVFTAGHPQSLLIYSLPTITDIEYDLPAVTISSNLQTRDDHRGWRIQNLWGILVVASSSLATEIELWL